MKCKSSEISVIAEHMRLLISKGINIGGIAFYDLHRKYFPNMPHPNTLFNAYLLAMESSTPYHPTMIATGENGVVIVEGKQNV